MSAVATSERTAHRTARAEPGSAPRLFEAAEVSLEDALLRVWEGLSREGQAECPVCGGRLAVGTGCEDCGSELA